MDNVPETPPAVPVQIRSSRRPNIVFAVCMIAAGILLFLANLGLFPIHRVWDLWPLIFVFIGLGRLSCSRTPGRILMGIAFIFIGVVATLFTTGVFHLHFQDGSWIISLVLIAAGVAGLARILDGERWDFDRTRFERKMARRERKWARRNRKFSFEANIGPESYSDTNPILNDHTMMGNIERKVMTQNFKGGKLTSVLGNIQIDMRRANMAEGEKTAYLETNAILGHISLRVPETWRVIWSGENVLGNFEDKTIPPNTGSEAPQLILTGSCTMGSIEIES